MDGRMVFGPGMWLFVTGSTMFTDLILSPQPGGDYSPSAGQVMAQEGKRCGKLVSRCHKVRMINGHLAT